jgi:2Fe-2S iron-sulfur cluster binding domain
MASYSLRVNGEARVVDVDPDTPMLYVLRDNLALKGPKFGCGLAQCGACVVHVDGEATRSCVLPVEAVKDRAITTLEGLGTSFHRRAGGAVRILRQRHDHDLRCIAGEDQEPQRIRNPRGARRQSLSLRDPSTHRRRCKARGSGLSGRRT